MYGERKGFCIEQKSCHADTPAWTSQLSDRGPFGKQYIHIFLLREFPIFTSLSVDIISAVLSSPLTAASTIRLLDNAVQNEFRIKSVLYNICSICVEECKILKKDKSSIVLPELVINYLMENYTKPISLKTMSKSLGYNYNYLSSFFHNNLKTSFCDCLNSYRINLAKTLLLDNSKSITDISAEVGFNTIRTFNRTFVSICGTTPTQYRKDFGKEAYIKDK